LDVPAFPASVITGCRPESHTAFTTGLADNGVASASGWADTELFPGSLELLFLLEGVA